MIEPVEVLILRQIRRHFTTINEQHLGGALRVPIFAFGDDTSTYATWRRDTRTITFSRHFVRSQPWGVVVEVLKHELAHAYAHEVLGAVDETPHGEAFKRVCERLGIDTRASGVPTASAVDPEQDRMLRRVQKLLALAESPNENEARAATEAARRLMLRYNLDTLPSEYSVRWLGLPEARRHEHIRWLAAILAEHFFVQVIWAHAFDVHEAREGKQLEITGTPANLEMAAYVYDFLLKTGERLWRAHRRAHRVGDRDRLTFLAGVMRGFKETLEAGTRASKAEGLVWVGDPQLQEWFRRRHPRLVHRSGTGRARTDAFESGRAAGQKIVLHKPVGGSTGGSGKLLG